jgi:hypothetical protein
MTSQGVTEAHSATAALAQMSGELSEVVRTFRI